METDKKTKNWTLVLAWVAATNSHCLGCLNFEYLFVTVLEARSLRSGRHLLSLVEALFPGSSGLLPVVPSYGEKGESRLSSSPYQDANPTLGGPLS